MTYLKERNALKKEKKNLSFERAEIGEEVYVAK
jgi:hypothetical protein